jgi:palmitoyltransferase
MFTRSSNAEVKTNFANQNVKIGELFEYIQNKNQDKIREYFQDPECKIWQLKDENGYTILHKSVFNSDMEMTDLIIKEAKRRLGMSKGDSLAKFINDKTNEGLTALHYAANKGSIPLLKLLIENGANVDAVTNLGKNLMHMAAEGNQPSMLIYLITEQHLSAQSVDENGSTPLHWACYSGAEEAVNFLLNLNVNINEQDKEKLTPLHLATNEGREKIVLKLLQKNADRNLANNKGELPIDLARKKNHKKIAEILGEEDFNPLCSLQMPKYYIQPKDIYKKFIILMIVIPEIVIYIFILPYLEGYVQTFINVPAFILSLLFYFIFIGKDPGYKKNNQMEKDARGKYPLIIKVNEGVDVRNYCPKCFIQKSYNIKHCFICDKCVEDFSHHCFWINKCIAKKNKALYIIFIFFSLIYANHSLFICLELLWDDVNLPYDSKLLHLYIFDQKRGFRVLGASACGVFSLIVGLPLWFLFLIEMLKLCRLFGNKKRNIESQLQEIILSTSDKSPDKLLAPSMVELREEKNELLIDDEEVDEKGLLLTNDEENLNNGTINDEEQEKIKESIANEEEQKQEDNNNEEEKKEEDEE